MKSGLEQVHGGLVDALDRGARIRVLTTDYLAITDAPTTMSASTLTCSARPGGMWYGRCSPRLCERGVVAATPG